MTAPDAPASRMSEETFERLFSMAEGLCSRPCEPFFAEARRAREENARLAERVRVLEEQAPKDAYELLDKADARREKLETALREIADSSTGYDDMLDVWAIAAAALAQTQDSTASRGSQKENP